MKAIAIAILTSCFAGTVYAQTPPAPMTSLLSLTWPARTDATRDVAIELHIKNLHERLKVTAAEEPLWAAVVKAMRDSTDDLDRMLIKRRSLPGDASAIDDLNSYADVAQTHADAVKKLSMAFGPLYAAMSYDQKRLADEVFTQRGRPNGKIGKLEK